VAVYDAGGRTVRRLGEGWFAPGVHAMHWDGRDSRGRPAATGIYFVRLEAGGRRMVHRIALTR